MFKSIPKSDSIFDIGLERAVELLAQARDGATVLRVLGDHPDDKTSIEICSGRYGPYVRHGKVNATLPKHLSPEAVTMEIALELIAAKGARNAAKPAKVVKAGMPSKGQSKPKAARPKRSATKSKTPAKAAKPAGKKVAANR